MFQLLWTQLEDKKHVATMEEIEYYYMHSVKNNKFSDMFVKVKLWGQSSSSFPKKTPSISYKISYIQILVGTR